MFNLQLAALHVSYITKKNFDRVSIVSFISKKHLIPSINPGGSGFTHGEPHHDILYDVVSFSHLLRPGTHHQIH